MEKNRIIIFMLAFALLLPLGAQAGVLSFDPDSGVAGLGDNIAFDLRLDVNAGCINTVEGFIEFPADKLVFQDFLTGESFLSLWVEKPSEADLDGINTSGVVHFAGGVPGGYCGRIPGDPGKSNILGKLIFRVPTLLITDEEFDMVEIKWGEGTRALLNDGLGTADTLITKDASYWVTDKPVNPDDWSMIIRTDKTSPEPFIVELHQDPSVFEGDYYIIFNTVDKQSGVDHYEVLEIGPKEEIGVSPEPEWWEKLLGREPTAPDWQTAEMPYRLEDQTLSSIIRVRAVDKAGNERLVEYIPPSEADESARGAWGIERIMLIFIIGFSLFIVVFIILIIRAKRRRRRSDDPSANDLPEGDISS